MGEGLIRSSPVTASYVNGQGTTVVSTPQSGSAVLTVQRPPSTGVSFNIYVDQESLSLASAIAAPPPAAPPPTGTASSQVRASALTSSKAAGLLASSGGTTTTPSARLQTKLVLTTVDPPPDPDVRPRTEAASS